MNISDEELMLLENLTYITRDVGREAGLDNTYVPIEEGITVGEFLKQFDEKHLKELDKPESILNVKGKSTHMQGNEWAAIIRTIKEDEELCNLKIYDIQKNKNGKTDAICFIDEKNADEAVVAFRGTLDKYEWFDNIKGLNRIYTWSQMNALNYVECLPFDNIITVGHSKGANKAQFCALLSDKVMRAVAMDGQGFSLEFYLMNLAATIKKGKCITNYSLYNDFVHELLIPVPGSKQLFFKGFGMENLGENHSPNSFFYVVDNGNGSVLKFEDGKLYLNPMLFEGYFITRLRCLVGAISSLNPLLKEDLINGLGPIVAGLLGNDNNPYETNGIMLESMKDKLFQLGCWEFVNWFNSCPFMPNFVIKDFSKTMYDTLFDIIERCESIVINDVNSWSSYSGEEWYSSVGVSSAIEDINSFIDELSEINMNCKSKIETVFANEWAVDQATSEKVAQLSGTVNGGIIGFSFLSERVACNLK